MRCHADFDWACLRIVDQLVREYAALPWRMSAAAYNQTEGSIVPLDPQTFKAAWATELAQALRSRNKAIFEEQVVRSLLDDLAKSNLLNKEESNDTKTRGAGESNSKDPSRQLSHE